MILFLTTTLAHAAPATSSTTLKSLTNCTVTHSCPSTNPVVAQPSGEILPPEPTLEAYIADHLFAGDVGAIAISVTFAGNTVDGSLLVALDASGNADPATWMGFASVTEDWDADGASDAVVGTLTWESRGQVQLGLAFMSAIDSAASFEPTREMGLTLTLQEGGSAVAPFNAWNLETLAIFDMEGNSLLEGSTGYTSVALDMNDFRYESALVIGTSSSNVTESAVWTVDGNSLLISGKGLIGGRSSSADLTVTASVDGAFDTETWAADASARSFRRSQTLSAVGDGSVRTSTSLDSGNTRRVRSSVSELADGTATISTDYTAAEDLSFSALTPTAVDGALWDRVAVAMSGG